MIKKKVIFTIDLKSLKGVHQFTKPNDTESDTIEALKVTFSGCNILQQKNENSEQNNEDNNNKENEQKNEGRNYETFQILDFKSCSQLKNMKVQFEKEIDELFYNEIIHNEQLIRIDYLKGKVSSIEEFPNNNNNNNNNEYLLGSFYFDIYPLLNSKENNLETLLSFHKNNKKEDDSSSPLKNNKKGGNKKEEKKEKENQTNENNEQQQTNKNTEPIKLLASISTNLPLVSLSDQENGNFLTMNAVKIENLPPTWIPKDENVSNSIFTYSAIFSIPLNEKDSQEYKIEGGNLIIEENDEENDENQENENENENENEEKKKKYIIVWEKNSSKTFFLTEEALLRIENICTSKNKFKVKIRRNIKPEFIGEGWTDENEKKYRGCFQFSISELLKPGKKVLTIKQQIEFDNQEDNNNNNNNNQDDGDKKKKRPNSAVPKKKKGGSPPPQELVKEEEIDFNENPEKHPFFIEKTKILFDFELSTPFILLPDERPRTKLKLKDLIPKRKKIQQILNPTNLFKKEIESSIKLLAYEFSHFKQENEGTNVFNKEEFIFTLNNSGKFEAIKEKLMSTILKIIEQKFSISKNKNEIQKHEIEKFHNDLYIYLIKHLNMKLNSIFEKSDQISNKTIDIDENKGVEKWKRLSDEAEVEMDNETAMKYYQNYVKEDKKNPQVWFNYGTFCMRIKDYTKSEQAFRESISLDMSKIDCLHSYGILLCIKNQSEKAEVFFQSAVDIDKKNFLSWGLLSLYYDLIEKKKLSHQNFLMANQLQKQFIQKTQKKLPPIRIMISQFLITLKADKLAERILLLELENSKPTSQTHLCFAKIYSIREDYVRAEESIKSAIEIDFKSVEAYTLWGNLHFKQKRFTESKQAFGYALSIDPKCSNSILHYRLGLLYLQHKEFEKAMISFQHATKFWHCGITFLGLGKAYYYLNKLNQAEQALNESNIQNNLNPNVWGYLSLVCAKEKRLEEAEKCLKQCKRLNLSDPNLISEIHQFFPNEFNL